MNWNLRYASEYQNSWSLPPGPSNGGIPLHKDPHLVNRIQDLSRLVNLSSMGNQVQLDNIVLNRKSVDYGLQQLIKAHNNPNALIAIHRTAPNPYSIQAGDWVTPVRDYPSAFSRQVMDQPGASRVLHKLVPARHLYIIPKEGEDDYYEGTPLLGLGYHPNVGPQ